MAEKKVYAKVGSEEITDIDINAVLRNMNPQQAGYFQSPEGKKLLVENIVRQKLIYLDAVDKKLDEDQEFISQLDQVKKDMLFQFALSKLQSGINQSDDAVKAYFEANKEKFFEQEQIKASHILVKDEAKSKEAYEKIQGGESFEDVCKEYSECEGTDLGYFPKGQMVEEFENVAFDLKVNDISEPVKTQFGYHIIKVYDKKPAQIKQYDEVKDSVYKDYMNETQRANYMKATDSLKGQYTIEMMD